MKRAIFHFIIAILPLAASAVPTPNIVEVISNDEPKATGDHVQTALGFIVEADGFLLTAYEQLVEPTNGNLLDYHFVRTHVGDEAPIYPARIIGVEPTLNFAVLQIEADSSFEPSIISRDQSLIPGQELYCVSDFMQPEENLVLGRLEALNAMECYQADMTATMFLAEMVISRASLGSPVFNKTGQVVAFYNGYEPPHDNEDDIDDPAETHLLPIFLVFNVYESIKQRKSLASPWTGFAVQPLNSEEQAQFPILNGKFTSGIAFNHIWKDSPAEKMGMQVGDILIRFAHHPIHSPADFQKWLYMYGVGREVDIYTLRGGEVLTYKYAIEERPGWAVPE